MARRIVHTDSAPRAIGTYSQAVVVSSPRETVYISGQIPLEPATGELVGGDIRTQIARVFDNLRAIAEAAGAGLEDTVRLTVYLCDLADFPAVNEVMASYFEEPYPARAAVGVAALPKGARIEMDAIVVR